MTERRVHGRPAAPGRFAGQVHVLRRADRRRGKAGAPDVEAAKLTRAIALSVAELERLAAAATGDAAEILGVQIAFLQDDALSDPAFASIGEGEAADAAWAAAVDAEIAGYAEAEDAYFRARAADLKDLRDRVLSNLAPADRVEHIPPGAVVVADDLPPSRFLSHDWSAGGAILLRDGSPTAHVAMLARARGVPMVVGLGDDVALLHGEVLADGATGEIVISPAAVSRVTFAALDQSDADLAAQAAALLRQPAMTKDGTQVAVLLNIASLDELGRLDPTTCDGIGLVRTEFMFDGPDLPDEAAQYEAYRRLVEWAGGRPVTIRTLDAGGDKPIAGLTVDGESNPFLGVRGIRLSLARPDVFRVQLRALARAATHGPLQIMLPMVTKPDEIAAADALLEIEVVALQHAGVVARRPKLGIMVEVPAAAIAIDEFPADFYSIGTNDLIQYVTAAGRDIAAVADLADPRHPAVMRLIANVARHGHETGREVCLCGDAASDPSLVPLLLRAGLRSLSVGAASLGRVKMAIADVDLGGEEGSK